MTTLETVLGFVIAFIVGELAAVLMIYSKSLEKTMYPLILFAQVIPKIAIAPLFVVWLGFGLEPKVVVAVLMAFFPIVISGMAGLKSVDPEILELHLDHGREPTENFLEDPPPGLPAPTPVRPEIDSPPYNLLSERFGYRSQNEEDGLLLALFKRIGTSDRRCVEIGYGLKNGGNSGFLVGECGWSGLMMDADRHKVETVKVRYASPRRDREQAPCHHREHRRHPPDARLHGRARFPEHRHDGNDYWVWARADHARAARGDGDARAQRPARRRADLADLPRDNPVRPRRQRPPNGDRRRDQRACLPR